MSTEHYPNQLKSAKAFTIKAYKKREFEASLVVNSQPKIDNNKLNMANTSNIKDKSKTWFWNNNANESNLNIEKKKMVIKMNWKNLERLARKLIKR